MLDCQLYGLHPGGHHLTNVLLHTATVIALFLVLRQMTGALWRSAFVAAVFAIHPLRVESVAWVAERKDVLSGLFFMLTIGAYVRYARRPWSPARYGLVVLLFALGLMCKPMLVTLPVVLLLLDYWPLQRVEPAGRLVLEKLPLLALSAASCVVTLLAQTGAIQSTESFSLPLRFANALVTCMVYLGQMVWPAGLAVFYPYPHNGLPAWEVVLAGMLLAGLSAVAWGERRKQPWLLIGWLWYLVMLLPVVGIIQVGEQAHADRYTYLPQIGIYVAVTWLVAEWRSGTGRVALGGLMAACSRVLMVCAWKQTAYWQNSETLWTHTLACTTDNDMAHNNLGNDLLQKGRVDDAISQYQKALQIKPNYAEAHNNLGNALLQKGRVDDAIAQCQKALQIKPDYAEAHNNLGNALCKREEWTKRSPNTKRRCKSSPTTRKPTTTSATFFCKRAEWTKRSPNSKGAANQARLRGSPQQPRQRSSPKEAEWTKRSPITKRRCKSSPTSRKPAYNLGNVLQPKGKSGRSDHPIPKGAANQARLRGSPQQSRQRSSTKRQGG